MKISRNSILKKKKYPHCLIQLSKKEYSDLKPNSIHVSGIEYVNSNIQYSNIEFVGSAIKLKDKFFNLDGVQTTLLCRCCLRLRRTCIIFVRD